MSTSSNIQVNKATQDKVKAFLSQMGETPQSIPGKDQASKPLGSFPPTLQESTGDEAASTSLLKYRPIATTAPTVSAESPALHSIIPSKKGTSSAPKTRNRGPPPVLEDLISSLLQEDTSNSLLWLDISSHLTKIPGTMRTRWAQELHEMNDDTERTVIWGIQEGMWMFHEMMKSKIAYDIHDAIKKCSEFMQQANNTLSTVADSVIKASEINREVAAGQKKLTEDLMSLQLHQIQPIVTPTQQPMRVPQPRPAPKVNAFSTAQGDFFVQSGPQGKKLELIPKNNDMRFWAIVKPLIAAHKDAIIDEMETTGQSEILLSILKTE